MVQRLGALERSLSSYLELVPQAAGTYHRAVPLACNADNIGRQKLKSLGFSYIVPLELLYTFYFASIYKGVLKPAIAQLV